MATSQPSGRLLHLQSTILMVLRLFIAGLSVDERLEPQRHAPFGQHLVRLAAGSLAACCSIVCCCMLLASSQRRPSAQQHPCDRTMSNTISISQALAARDRGTACTVTGLQWHRCSVRGHLHATLLSGQLQSARALHASELTEAHRICFKKMPSKRT